MSTATTEENPPRDRRTVGNAADTAPSAILAARVNRRSRARSAEALRRLIGTVIDAETWDENVYFTRPPGDWVLLTRDSWADMKAAVEAVDAYRPWES